MNIKKLFEMQKVLDDRITKEHKLTQKYTKEQLIINRILGLIVEVGEDANEWREFKFWSLDRKPRRKKMLEEYVDGLHFLLSLGLEIGYQNIEFSKVHSQKMKSITGQFILVTKWASALLDDDYYFELFHAFIHLGEMLGFTWEQIEQAYMDKNKINHLRQDQGY